MKKTLSALTILVLAFTMTACSAASSPTVPDPSEPSVCDLVIPRAPVITPSETLNPYTVEETLLYDQNGFKITALPLNDNLVAGVSKYETLYFLYESNEEQTVIFKTERFDINGIDMNSDFGGIEASVYPGKPQRQGNTLPLKRLAELGITDIGTIDLEFSIRRLGETAPICTTGLLHLETALENEATIICMPENSLLYDQNNIRFYVIYNVDPDTGDLVFNTYTENRTGSEISVQMVDMTRGKDSYDRYVESSCNPGCTSADVSRISADVLDGHDPSEFLYTFSIFNLSDDYSVIAEFNTIVG